MKKIILPAILSLPLLGFSQYEFYNKGAAITIQETALIHVQGSFTNANGSTNGSVVNNGMIEVKGDFENDANSTFKKDAPGTHEAAVKFVGTGKQYIKGNMNTPGTASFYNLVVDQKTNADTVEMMANVTVEGSLVFGSGNSTNSYSPSYAWTDNGNHGLLKTFTNSSENVLNITNGSTDAIKGYPALVMNGNPSTSFVLTKGSRGSANGGLKRYISNKAAYDFPFGTEENGYNAVRLNFSNIPGIGGSVMGKFCDGTSNPRGVVGYISQYCIGCNSITSPTPDNLGYNRYFPSDPYNSNKPQWLILEDNGITGHGYWSFDATDNNTRKWVYTIQTYANSFDLPMGGSPEMDTWRTLKYHNSNGDYGFDPSGASIDWRPQIDSVSTPLDLLTYTKNAGLAYDGVPGGVYTDFSHFGMFKANSNNALPVELIYLNADPIDNKYIKVSWATAVEINNDGFDVLRSVDGVHFTKIGWVDGHDNTTVIQNYAFDDHNVAANIVYYYKLRQVDNDGQDEETYVVSAMLTGSETFVISDFIPNPTKDASKIVITTSTAQTVEVRLYDIVGQILSNKTHHLTEGSNYINFEVGNLADGTYTAIINANNKVYSKKLVVTKQ